MFYSGFLYGIIPWIFKSVPVRSGGEGLRWVSLRTPWREGRSKLHVRIMGERGQILSVLVRMY